MARGTLALVSFTMLLAAGCGDDRDSAASGGAAVTGGTGGGGGVGAAMVGGAFVGGGGQGGASSGAEGGAGGEPEPPCPSDMELVTFGPAVCMDRYEAPNVAGALPLVMFSLLDGAAWCSAREKRICRDDEWTAACEGPDSLAFPYGVDHVAGLCNDEKTWMVYNQSLLNGWPPSASGPAIESFEQQLAEGRAVSIVGAMAADHVEALYQAEPAGTKDSCVGPASVFDLCGNVEEWTERADGGDGAAFTGNLKGRYWAETRTCQQSVTNHADAFRFYETGFRCCKTPQ